MTGLILKDFINLKKQGKVLLLLLVFYAIYSAATKSIYMFTSITYIFSIILPVTALAYDEKSNWDKYCLTMPVSRNQIVCEKYLLSIILTVIISIINLIFSFIMTKKLDSDTLKIFFTASQISIIMASFILPLVFKLGVEKGRIAMMIIFLVPTILIMMSQSFLQDFFNGQNLMLLLKLLPVITLILLSTSTYISIIIYKRKEL